MGDRDKVSSIFSIIIACLIVVPCIDLIMIGNKVGIGWTLLIGAVSIILYILALIFLTTGVFRGGSKKITVGFGLGISSWTLGIILVITPVIEVAQAFLPSAITAAMISGSQPSTTQLILMYALQQFSRILDALSSMAIIQLFSMIFCLIGASIIFERRKIGSL